MLRLSGLLLLATAASCSRAQAPALAADDAATAAEASTPSSDTDASRAAPFDPADSGWTPVPTIPTLRGPVCTPSIKFGIHVSVTTPQHQPICNARVTLVGEGRTEQLEKVFCGYRGAAERSGTFSVLASAPGFQPGRIDKVVIGYSGCHVDPRDVTLVLRRK